LIAVVVGLAATAAVIAAAQPDPASLAQAVLAAEDSRAPAKADIDLLLRAAGGDDVPLQARAVRALGRLERPELVDELRPFLAAASPAVRAEAANAIGQTVILGSRRRVQTAARALRDRLKTERDPSVRGVIAATLGQLPYTSKKDVESVESDLLKASWLGDLDVSASSAQTSSMMGVPVAGVTLSFGRRKQDAPVAVVLGVAQGFESLVRRSSKIYTPSREAIERLRTLASVPVEPRPDEVHVTGFAEVDEATIDAVVRIRRLALQAIATAKVGDDLTVGKASRDPDPQVRRLALLAAPAARSADGFFLQVTEALSNDPDFIVRVEAARVYGRSLREGRGCQPLVDAIHDVNTHVKLAAIDGLGAGCREPAGAVAALEPEVEALDKVGTRFWHAPAHALVSLASLAPDRAARWLPRFAAHAVWQVRMYAARAAAAMNDGATLERLVGDASANVREAAVSGLAATRGHEADSIYLAALSSRDYQLLRTAARALEGTPQPGRALPGLFDALARVTGGMRDTSRDARVALLETVRGLGTAADAESVEPYLEDFDPRIAALAASILTAWTGRSREPRTLRLETGPPPEWAEVVALDGARARVFMADGSAFEMTLHAADAPATVARFVSLAKAGYYDGLSFHRVVSDFVIQGGSPGANEYAGDGRFMRDEVGLRPHVRGAVGISTRGRDTGDAQIFVDLVDNPRLDHDFTVFADVTRGMDAVDGVLEGAVIERVEIVE